MGFDAHISYGMTWLKDENTSMSFKQELWFILAGPLQTMLTGTTGILLLFFSARQTDRLSVGRWVMIFISLFWLRQFANLVIWIANYIITGKFGTNADEIKLSMLLNLPSLLIISATALIGLVVLTIVLYRFIPITQRLTFVLSGLLGGISGYLFWLVYFGKIIMP